MLGNASSAEYASSRRRPCRGVGTSKGLSRRGAEGVLPFFETAGTAPAPVRGPGRAVAAEGRDAKAVLNGYDLRRASRESAC